MYSAMPDRRFMLLTANHRIVTTDLELDNPRVELEGLIHRVKWDDWIVKQIAGVLRLMVAEDRETDGHNS